MWQSKLLAGLTLTCSLSLATVAACADDTVDDVHCYIVYMQMGSSKSAALQTAGMVGSLYWIGRLDGRTPKLDIESLIISELPKMTGAVFQSEAKRCGSALMTRGKIITDMGRDMEQRGEKMLQSEESH